MRQQIGGWCGTFAAAAPRAPLEGLLRVLGRDEQPDAARVVKRSRAREVLRVPLAPDDALYVKRYPLRSWRDRMLARLGMPRAALEYTNLRRLRELEVRAAEPLAWAVRRVPGRSESLLVTREIPDAVPLGDARERLGAQGMLGLLGQVARQARRLHDAGLWLRDLHAGNVLVAPVSAGAPQPWFVDVQKLRVLPWALPGALRARDLAVLYDDLRYGRSRDERERLLQVLVDAYAAAATPAPDAARLRDAVARAAGRRWRLRLRSRGRRCITPSSGFRVERAGPWRIHRRADVPRAEVLRVLAESPPGLPGATPHGPRVALLPSFEGGPPAGSAARPFDRGQGAPEPGTPARGSALVREFPGRGLPWSGPPDHARRGMQAWRRAHALLLRGFDTPAPLALLEERRAGCPRRSLVLVRAAGLVPFPDRLADAAAAPALVHACGRLLADLHAAGVAWGNTTPADLALRTEAGSSGRSAWVLTAPERLRLPRRLSRRRRRQDLARLAAALEATRPGGDVHSALLAGYREAACGSDPTHDGPRGR